MIMRTVQALAVTMALLTAAELRGAEPVAGVVVEVSRNGKVKTLAAPDALADAIFKAVQGSAVSSEENPGEHWDEVYRQPNWIHVRLRPARAVSFSDGQAAVREVLILFPTSAEGRRWADFILLRTETRTLSRAKWDACAMRDIVMAASFDPKTEAPPFNTYCPGGVR
jgi:hypothetical protein